MSQQHHHWSSTHAIAVITLLICGSREDFDESCSDVSIMVRSLWIGTSCTGCPVPSAQQLLFKFENKSTYMDVTPTNPALDGYFKIHPWFVCESSRKLNFHSHPHFP